MAMGGNTIVQANKAHLDKNDYGEFIPAPAQVGG